MKYSKEKKSTVINFTTICHQNTFRYLSPVIFHLICNIKICIAPFLMPSIFLSIKTPPFFITKKFYPLLNIVKHNRIFEWLQPQSYDLLSTPKNFFRHVQNKSRRVQGMTCLTSTRQITSSIPTCGHQLLFFFLHFSCFIIIIIICFVLREDFGFHK